MNVSSEQTENRVLKSVKMLTETFLMCQQIW